MSGHTFTTYNEFGELGECELKLTYFHQAAEADTNTAESIEVEEGSVKYNGQWLDLAEEDYKKFEQACWDNLGEDHGRD